MSSVYIQEPATSGKVLIHTTYGDLEVELWCKEAPKACRNFIQLALEGYYDETIFHRLVPKFILQAGDPTETGSGGESIYGAPFKIESHSRLSFNRRGLLGMAAVTQDGLLTSQFFFTLDTALELDKKNTMFGRVVGDTIYNLLRIGEIEVDPATERPLYPPKITTIEILLNPFDDIVPRELPEVAERLLSTKGQKAPETKQKPVAVAIKNKTLLSFQEDEEEEDEIGAQPFAKIMSSHDVLNDPTLSKEKTDLKNGNPKHKEANLKPPTELSEYTMLQNEKKEQLKEIEESIASVQNDLKRMERSQEPVVAPESKKQKTDSLSSLLGRKPKEVSKQSKSFLQEQRDLYRKNPNYIVGKRKKDAVEDVNTLLTLNSFKSKLHSVDVRDPTSLVKLDNPEPAKELNICKLHGLVNCLSCRDTFGLLGKDEDVGEEGWLMHRLVFDKEAGYREVREDLTNLVVIDPREKAKEILKKK